ncbi:hypothetical protein EXIGLDRAFT_779123 [Exidia glandulosa HHB12029]|uniref:F-box domain-containing protein n=1 Tax=Exidia glandulosa HHB12029 TaxID=1314781 RepID=A0A165C7T3_EXIGL|nr:hypothetical protein EXIGLDRAFT_779123 [Exidia glandulosa HHB12029]
MAIAGLYGRGIRRLPVELFTRTLALLEVQTLLTAARVCHEWRIIALDDPNFWRIIRIDNTSPRTLALADLQLRCSRARAVDLYIDYRQQDDLVESRVVPFISKALSTCRWLQVKLESLYRLQVEKALSSPAPFLETFSLLYAAEPLPDLHLRLPLSSELFAGTAPKLRSIRLHSIILPMKPIAAFLNAQEVFWVHAASTYQEEFPCYLFEFFPKLKRLRMSGGECYFRNAPLPTTVLQAFSRLEYFDLEFKEVAVPLFFRHLPIHDLPDVLVASPDEDAIYLTLDPLRSPFELSIYDFEPGTEFFISIKCGQSNRTRYFAERYAYYVTGSKNASALFENNEIAAQLASFRIQASLWSMLNPWLFSLLGLPILIVELDRWSPDAVALPVEPLACPNITTLVLQSKWDFVSVNAGDLLEFVDRITLKHVALHLRGVVIRGDTASIAARFDSIEHLDLLPAVALK